MKLYVVRHGQTTYNLENRICGVSDVPLTKLGESQARLTCEKLKHIHFDSVYVSPLIRAVSTASLITNQQFIIDKRLAEINFGIFEGQDIKTKEFYDVKYHLGLRYPNGETFLEVIHRVYSFLDELKQTDNENVLIVCHGGIVRAIHSYFYEMTNEDIFTFSLENCAILEYSF
jgi:probable phosphoglycerate mutase